MDIEQYSEIPISRTVVSFLLQAAVILNDILPSLKSMAHWMQDNDIQQVSITPGVGRVGRNWVGVSHVKLTG